MVETYGADECRFYFIEEATFGVTPTNPAMLGEPADLIEPTVDPSLIKLRGVGNYDLMSHLKGLHKPDLRISYPLPSSAPIALLQWLKRDLDKSLTMQVIYWKGSFAGATDIISLLYTGMRWASATVEAAIDDVVKCSADFMGQNLTTGTAKISGASYADHVGAVPYHESYVKIAGSTNERATAWKVNVDNAPKRVPVIRISGGNIAKYIPFGPRSLTGEITFEFETKTELDDLLIDTEQSSVEFGLGGAFKLNMQYVKWEKVVHTTKVEDLIWAKVAYSARGPLAIT